MNTEKNAPDTKAKSVIDAEMNRLRQQVQRAHSRYSDLNERLLPIRDQSPLEKNLEGEGDSQASNSPMTNELKDIVQEVTYLINRMERTMDELEL